MTDTNIKISKRAQKMSPSATLAMAAKAKELVAKGIDVVSFTTGEPDFDTPSFIRDEAKRSLDAGDTKYTVTSGIPDLKNAIREKLSRDNDLKYETSDICVFAGAKQAIYNALQVIINPGDEVIIPSPYWVSYPEQVCLAGGIPQIIQTMVGTNFKVTKDALLKAISNKTRAIIINSPSNPTGSAYTKKELSEIAKICVENNIAIISDEIYEKLVYDGFTHTSIASVSKEALDITIVINGVSKAYAMAGWRMGYAAGPKNIISKMAELTGQQTTCLPAFIQKACAKAIGGATDEIESMRKEFEARRDLMLEKCSEIPNFRCHKPDGAFYLLPNVGAYLNHATHSVKMKNANELAMYLLEDALVATVSGDAFGAPGHLRLSYATSQEKIIEGMRRIKEGLKCLSA